jgi:hypothetical protein
MLLPTLCVNRLTGFLFGGWVRLWCTVWISLRKNIVEQGVAVGKSSLIDSLIGQCPFCGSSRRRNLDHQPNTVGSDDSRGGDGSGRSVGPTTAIESIPTMGGGVDGDAAAPGSAGGGWTKSKNSATVPVDIGGDGLSRPRSLKWSCRLAVFKNQVKWNRTMLPRDVMAFLVSPT